MGQWYWRYWHWANGNGIGFGKWVWLMPFCHMQAIISGLMAIARCEPYNADVQGHSKPLALSIPSFQCLSPNPNANALMPKANGPVPTWANADTNGASSVPQLTNDPSPVHQCAHALVHPRLNGTMQMQICIGSHWDWPIGIGIGHWR